MGAHEKDVVCILASLIGIILRSNPDIELFQGYMCPGIPVTEDLTIEVEFSDEEVAKIRQLVKDYTGDKRAGLMPILQDDAPELHERIAKAAFQEIYDFYLLDGLRNGYIELDEADQRRNFKKDLESGEFNPEWRIQSRGVYRGFRVVRRSPYRRRRVVQPLGRVGT